jgi:hypothetical protein
MAKKFVSDLSKGDTVVVQDGVLGTISEIHPAGGKNVAIEFTNAPTMIIDVTTVVPVVQTRVDVSMSIDEVYNMVLDDQMSLVEFTSWVEGQKK